MCIIMLANDTDSKRWTDLLADEDLSFLKRFLLASGSLKELAGVYKITYPTIRLRLDRLIDKVKIIESQQITSPFERLIRSAFADGKIDIATLKSLMASHKEEMESRHE